MVPLPDPEAVTVHQAELLVADHAVLLVTVKFVFPATALTFWFDGVTDKVGEPAACVTVTVTGVSPVTVTVTLATRVVSSTFCV